MSNHRSDDINWLFKKKVFSLDPRIFPKQKIREWKNIGKKWSCQNRSSTMRHQRITWNQKKFATWNVIFRSINRNLENEKKYAKQDIQRRDRIDLIVRRTDELSPQVLLSQIKTIRQSRFSQLQTKIRVKKENKTFFHRIKNTNPIYNLHDMRAHEKEHMSRMKYLAKSSKKICLLKTQNKKKNLKSMIMEKGQEILACYRHTVKWNVIILTVYLFTQT